MDVSDNRMQDLEARTYHIDGRVSAIEAQLTTQSATLTRVESAIMALSKGEKPNVVGWVGLAVSGIIGLLTLVFTMGKWVDLQMVPVRDKLSENAEFHAVMENFRHQQHYEVGVLHTEKEQVESEISRLWEHIHKQEEIDRQQDSAIARAEVARKAMGDYVRQIDELGSRRWMSEEPREASRVGD